MDAEQKKRGQREGGGSPYLLHQSLLTNKLDRLLAGPPWSRVSPENNQVGNVL